MGGDLGFWGLHYSMRRAAYGYLCFRSAARFGSVAASPVSPLAVFVVAAVVQKIRGGVAGSNRPAEEGGEGRLRLQTGKKPSLSADHETKSFLFHAAFQR
jgi:hypothetical protein